MLSPQMPLVLDAIRTKDKTKIVLRSTRTDTNELSLAKRLCDPALLQNPRNHTVPILDIIPIPDEEEKQVFMVLPMLKNFYAPSFHCQSEFAEALRQPLEGLDFMHGLNIAHVSPEFSLGLQCNPFKLDVYNAGATFFELCEEYQGLDDFKPLLLDMMSEDPLARPDMAEALRELDDLVSSNDEVWLQGRIWKLCSWIKPPSNMVQYLWRRFPVLLPYF